MSLEREPDGKTSFPKTPLAGTSVPGPATDRCLRILVVDDEPALRDAVARILRTRGHEILCVATGRAALDEVGRNAVDAVICDLNMPGFTGDQLCEALRERFGRAAPPVVMISGADAEEDVGRALDSGAWHYLRKPFASGELIAIVERAARSAARAKRDAALGDRIGPYQLRGELGRGGMGVVYRARRDGASEDVALKILPESSESLEDQLRFRRELDLLASLDHPGIARLLESGQAGQRPYYTMELVPGVSLATEIRDGPIAEARVTLIGRDVAATLAYVHGRQILHRDVKPGNIVLAPGKHPRLIDFGLARRPKDLSLTSREEVRGTPLYLAPEAADRGTVTSAADIFALGVTLYEALLGRHPFPRAEEASALEVVGTYARNGLAPVRVASPGTSERLADLIGRSIDAVPARRPTAVELSAALAGFLRDG